MLKELENVFIAVNYRRCLYVLIVTELAATILLPYDMGGSVPKTNAFE